MLRVSDLRQYTYCPRIVYYAYCLPRIRPETFNMEAGQLAHREEEGRERRRSLRAYRVADGTRYFDHYLESEDLGLQGKVDMVIHREQEIIPVEYKNSPGRSGRHVILQLTAYGMLLEAHYGVPARRGFIYYIPARRAREVPLDAPLKLAVAQTVEEIEIMIQEERMPPPPNERGKCAICEFRRFCNDVV